MVKSKSWEWNAVLEPIWREPAEDIYYLAARWKRDNRMRILDLGCGVGRHSIFLAQHGFSVDAFDLSPDGISMVQQTAHEMNLPITTKMGDMLTLPYDSGQFDCVLAFHTIYHTDKPGIERVISEIARVLSPHGEVFVTFNSLTNPVFSDSRNRPIGKNTIVKTQGIEAGIPHYGVDESEIKRLMSRFEFIKFAHTESIGGNDRSWHYFVLAKKC